MCTPPLTCGGQVEVGGQFSRVNSLILPSGSQMSNSDQCLYPESCHQPQSIVLSVDTSHQDSPSLIWKKNVQEWGNQTWWRTAYANLRRYLSDSELEERHEQMLAMTTYEECMCSSLQCCDPHWDTTSRHATATQRPVSNLNSKATKTQRAYPQKRNRKLSQDCFTLTPYQSAHS